MGQNHLRVLSEIRNVKIDYLYDKNASRLKKLAKIYGAKICKNLNEIKSSSDGVIISTPSKDHFTYLKYFSQTKLKMFVEKPIVSNYSHLLKIRKLLKNKILQCGFIERYNSVTPLLKKIINKSKVISIEFRRTDKLSDRVKDVDVIHDLMIHDIDLSILFNGKVKNIIAHGYKKKNQICYATATLVHKNNVISKIEASRITQKNKID